MPLTLAHPPPFTLCCASPNRPPPARYLPLEVMNGDHSRLDKADMFALGMTLYELATRAEPPSGGQLYQDLRHGKVPLLVAASASLAKLIK